MPKKIKIEKMWVNKKVTPKEIGNKVEKKKKSQKKMYEENAIISLNIYMKTIYDSHKDSNNKRWNLTKVCAVIHKINTQKKKTIEWRKGFFEIFLVF